jgi:hypothetical protein
MRKTNGCDTDSLNEEKSVGTSNDDIGMSGVKQKHGVELFGALPTALVCLTFSYNRGAEHVVLWRTARALWPLLCMAAASPAEFCVWHLDTFVKRAGHETKELAIQLTPHVSSLAPCLHPRKLRIFGLVDVDGLTRLSALAFARTLHTLSLVNDNTSDVFAPRMHLFPNLCHVHGAPTLTPVRKKARGAPWSSTD